jgi:Uma2 family endonuclease
MRYEAYLTWADEDMHAEWVPIAGTDQGEVIIHMPPKDIHQVVVGFLHSLLSLFVSLFDVGQLRIAPLEVKLQPEGASREPDLLFIANEHLARLTPDRVEGPPDLIIEIVSKDSVKRDRDDKLKEYQAAGVREYWIIDPRSEKQRADFYCLEEATGTYHLYATEDDERVTSRTIPGFWLKPVWLWDAENQNPLFTLCEIADWPESLVEQLKAQIATDTE